MGAFIQLFPSGGDYGESKASRKTMRYLKTVSTMAAGALAAIAAMPGAAGACAMCGLSAGDHAERAFGWSVLAMLSAPYLTAGAVGGTLYFAWRRAHREQKQ